MKRSVESEKVQIIRLFLVLPSSNVLSKFHVLEFRHEWINKLKSLTILDIGKNVVKEKKLKRLKYSFIYEAESKLQT